MILKTYDSQEEVLRGLTEQLIERMKLQDAPFRLALSGAGTAQKMFRLWREEFRDRIHWEQLRFYWVDERCVGPREDESNYGHACDLLFGPLDIPSSCIHRIRGEADPEIEAERYSGLVRLELPEYAGLPRFHCTILGIGEDGHTASIFPANRELLTDRRCYAVSEHPSSGQKRITMTGPLILNSEMILIPVTGKEKTTILGKVLAASKEGGELYPASYVISRASEIRLFTDVQLDIRREF